MATFGLGKIFLGVVIGAAAVVAVGVYVMPAHGPMQHMLHESGLFGHDMETMPGLRGADASPEETAEMGRMFSNFTQISREVTELPNGIRTVTFTLDQDLMDTIASHVMGMLNRVETGRDPQVIVQSPTLDILFERRESIVTEVEMTDVGIVVTQTSDDPEVVAALKAHAAEVSDMVDRGMDAVHERMMGG